MLTIGKAWFTPLSLWLFSIFIGLLVWWVSILIRNKKEKSNQAVQSKLNEVVRKTHNNGTVILDGHHFVSCKFTACNLEYNGGDFILDQSDMRSDCVLKFNTKESRSAAQLISVFLSLINDDINNGKKSNMFTLDNYGRVSKNIEVLNELK